MNDKVTHSGGGLSKAGHSTGTAGTMAVVLMAVGTGAGCSHGPQAEQAAQKARCFASETQASKEMLRVDG